MIIKKIKVKSSFGHDIINQLFLSDLPASRLAVFLPGASYTCQAPLLHFAREALEQYGAENYETVHLVGKSLGSIVQGELARRIKAPKVKQLFLTPVADSIPYINEAVCVVVTGTNDHLFKETHGNLINRDPGTSVHLIPGANHGLQIEGDYLASPCVVWNKCAGFIRSSLQYSAFRDDRFYMPVI